MSFIEERKALTREKRLGAFSHYDGTLESLFDEVQGSEIKQRLRTFCQSTYDEILYAVRALSGIEDIAVILHGSAGCSACGVYYHQMYGLSWYSTNLNERDTILGGEEKLRRAVLRAQEETGAKAIFIVGTPVVAINNDDVNSVILELEDELGIKLISVGTDGFQTKAAVSGYDMVLHGLLRHVVERGGANSGEKEDFINVVSISENRENDAAMLKILKDLEIPFQFLPQFSGIEQIERAGRARATITLNPDEGGYFAEELEEVFGIPYIRAGVPAGLRGTRHWILKLAKELGIEERAKKYVEQQEGAADKQVHLKPLEGKQVFLDIDLALAVHFTYLIEKLGGSITGISVPYVDLQNRENLKKLHSLSKTTTWIVANGQPFEKANVLSKKTTDFYISLGGQTSFALSQGAIPISLSRTGFLGYEGLRSFLKQLEIGNRLLECNWLKRKQEPSLYQPSWLKKSSNWYVKQEVR